uniref:(northern house mosquito) hypothetical protein n=2 Tax=Culex pipiens TaxID=7175 RepID=A0A8D8EVQ5_CULPI
MFTPNQNYRHQNNLFREGWLSPRWMHFQRSRLQVNHSYETSSPHTTLPSLHRSSILVWFPFTAAQNLETAPASLPDDDIISSSPREIHTRGGVCEKFSQISGPPPLNATRPMTLPLTVPRTRHVTRKVSHTWISMENGRTSD